MHSFQISVINLSTLSRNFPHPTIFGAIIKPPSRDDRERQIRIWRRTSAVPRETERVHYLIHFSLSGRKIYIPQLERAWQSGKNIHEIWLKLPKCAQCAPSQRELELVWSVESQMDRSLNIINPVAVRPWTPCSIASQTPSRSRRPERRDDK